MTRRLLPFGLFIAVALAPAASFATSGGPDAFGYTWTDDGDPTIPFTTSSVPLVLGADEVSAPIDLGFSFPLYGVNATRFVISSNGWISFDTASTTSQPTPQPLPAVSAPNHTLAWFWRDLDAPSTSSFHGPMPGGYKVRVITQVPGGITDSIFIEIGIYQTGMIKVHYLGLSVPETGSVGIENVAGTIGLNPSYLGTGENGFVLSDGKALTYFPPPQLSCAGAGAITCGQTLTFSSPASVSPNVSAYTCGTNTYLGRERVIAFTNPSLADVTITLTRQPNPPSDMDVFLLKEGMCNEFQCLDGGADTVTESFLGTGTYYIVVDGKKAGDNGTFDLQVTCTPKSAVLNCQNPGDPPVRGSTSGVSQWDIYPCSNVVHNGPEFVYEIPFTAPGNIKMRLTPDPGLDMNIIAFGPNTFDAPAGCIDVGSPNLTLFNPPSGTYYAVIDGVNGSTGGFTLGVTCDILLNCAAPVGALQCYTETAGTTVGATNRAETYACSQDTATGPEVVYTFRNDVQRTISFKWNGPPDLALYLVDATCNEGACLRSSSRGRLVYRDLPVGDYYIVVDGKNGASGAFTIKPICDNKVDPDSGAWVLAAGTTTHETKALTVTGEPTYGDLMFAIDQTGSMGNVIAELQNTSQQIITQLSAQVDDVAFALSTLEDYNHQNPGTNCGAAGYSSGADLPYRLNLPMTRNIAKLFEAIATLRATGGGDGPESYLHAYEQMYADAGNIGWRPGARQIVVMMGDNDAHTCETTCGHTANGAELGPDFTPGTADDVEPTPLFDEYRRRGMTPLFFQTSQNTPLFNQWDCWTKLAGGRAWDSPQGVLPSGFVLDVKRAIESRTLICYDLRVGTTPGFENWLTNMAPAFMTDVYLPVETGFDFDIGPPAGTTPGIYNFNVEFLCDGGVKATQTVSIEVPGVCTPQAAIALTGTTCAGDLRTLDASGSTIPGCPAPAVVEWQWKDEFGVVIQPWSPTGQVLTQNPIASTSYTVEIRCSDQGACPFLGTRLQNVNVDPDPPADAGPDASLCLNESAVLGSATVPGMNYSWSPSTELDNPLIAQPTVTTTGSSPTGPRVYTVTVTDSVTGCVSTDTVTVDVVSGAPIGAIANNLRAVEVAGADVQLNWRGMPLSIRSYNIHRETSKLSIAPPASAAIGNVAGDELYTDLGAIALPALRFYEVYGRDCAGLSIFN